MQAAYNDLAPDVLCFLFYHPTPPLLYFQTHLHGEGLEKDMVSRIVLSEELCCTQLCLAWLTLGRDSTSHWVKHEVRQRAGQGDAGVANTLVSTNEARLVSGMGRGLLVREGGGDEVGENLILRE